MKRIFVVTSVFVFTLSMLALSVTAAPISYWEELDKEVAQVYNSYGDTPFYQEYLKRTGAEVEFVNAAGGAEQFNLMMASGEFTDVIFNRWFQAYPGAPAKLFEDGVAIPLNDLLAEHAPNFMKLMEEHPDWRKAVTLPDGTYWCFPFIRGDLELMVFFGPYLRKDYLDKLNLPVPETIDEWTDTLRALKTLDEVDYPLLSAQGQGGRNFTYGQNFIGAYKIQWDWYIGDDGKVHYGQYEPAYKDFLALWNMWYKEGLLHPDFLTMDRKGYDVAILNGTVGASVGFGGSSVGNYLQAMKDKGTSFDLVGAMNPVLVKGEKPWTAHIDEPFNGRGAIITTQAKDPVAAVKWMDYLYSPEGHMLVNFGLEGVSYDWAEDFPGFEGKKFPKYTELIMNNPDGITVSGALKMWMRSGFNGPFVQDKRYLLQYYQLPQQLDAWKKWSYSDALNHKMPSGVTLTPEEGEDFADIMSQVATYMEEKYAAFTMGTESLENFDEYRAEMKRMGIEEAIAMQQAAYERYLAK